MAFDAGTVNTLYDQLVSHAQALGVFDAGVNESEPWNAPGDGTWCYFAAPSITPVGRGSGAAAVSARLEFRAVVGVAANARSTVRAEKLILTAAAGLLGAYSGAFTLAAAVRCVDLLGMYGAPMSGAPAWMSVGETRFRVYELVVPLIVDDLWTEVA